MQLQLFDAYNLRSRFSVSVFYALPFVIDIVCITGVSLTLSEGFLVSAVLVVLCQTFLSIIRSPVGNRTHKNTTAEILASKTVLTPGVRSRYYRKLALLEPEFVPILDYLQQADGYTDAAVCAVSTDIIPWLRAKTRDPQRFRLVYEENINYSYVRNLQRLKPLGLVFNILVLLWSSTKIFPNICTFSWEENATLVLLVAMHLCVVVYLIFGVTRKSVDSAATRYAYALLETIDIL